ncbi:MAG: tRNA pseudouridine(38-40) synthase TruA [Fimbriimonadales bacterium]|nr:tRNA pseudouridine(38-40) synthase TruA [Fimbriimonadales bacterium]
MRNLRLLIEYDGTDFHGFARQTAVRTVQGVLETTLQSLLREPVQVIGASRTDAGVHARGQVVNFITSSAIPAERLVVALNRRLPPDLKVRRAAEVPPDFHARHSARSRLYRYTLYTRPHPSVWHIRYACHYPYPLDTERMAQALQSLEGMHDFRAFSIKTPEEQDTVRTLYRTALRRGRATIQIELEGSGFLRGMVRLIVGSLLLIGRGRLPADALQGYLHNPAQRLTTMAPPQGLCLIRVNY